MSPAERGLCLAVALLAASVPARADFDPPVFPPTGSTGDIQLADMDGDGDLDIVAAVYSPGPERVQVFWNDGLGAFTAGPSYSPPQYWGVDKLAVGDFDADGVPDIAIASLGTWDPFNCGFCGYGVLVIRNNVASLTLKQQYWSPYGPYFYPFSVQMLDMDGDGDLDIATTGGDMASNAGALSVLVNDGTGRIGSQLNTLAPSPPYGYAFDINGDGLGDFVVSLGPPTSEVRTYTATGPGAYAMQVVAPVNQVGDLSRPLDIDSDGSLDLVGYVGVLLHNDGKGTFTVEPLAAGGQGYYYPGIVNGDASPDLILDYEDGATYNWIDAYLHVGSNSYRRVPSTTLPYKEALANADQIVVGDLDGNGLGDIVLSISTTTQVFMNRWPSLNTSNELVLARGPAVSNLTSVLAFRDNGQPLSSASFSPYSAGFGANLATGKIDTSGRASYLTGPGPGGVYGPQIRAFHAGGSPVGKVNFFAYGTLKYGAKPGSGEMDGDGYDEILTTPGAGQVFGPHVRGFNFDGAQLQAMSKLSFFAYGTLKYGANASSGDLDVDGLDEILTGPGPGPVFGSQVRGFNFDGGPVQALPINFFAFSFLRGVEVSGGDFDGDGRSDIGAIPGPDPNATASLGGYKYDGVSVAALSGMSLVTMASKYGGVVASGELDGDSTDEATVGVGPDPAYIGGRTRTFSYNGSALIEIADLDLVPFPGTAYGLRVAIGDIEP